MRVSWNDLTFCGVRRETGEIEINLLRQIAPEKIRSFVEKYTDVDGRALTEAEQNGIEFESPLVFPYQLQFFLGGRRMERWEGRSDCWYPPECRPGIAAGCAEPEWLSTYGCDRRFGWSLATFRLHPEEGSDRGGRLTVRVRPRAFSLSCEPAFETEAGCGPREVRFVHPLDGSVHRLQILSARQEELTASPSAVRQEYDIPRCFQLLECRFDSEQEAQLFSVRPCGGGDEPVRRGEKKRGRRAGGATAIGIIGGRSGGPKEQTVCSAPTFAPARRALWRVDVQVCREAAEETEIVLW